jgi:CheY-like chemotaxis protein
MLRVLIVDDEPVNQEILLEYLSDSGYALETADDGVGAWAALEAAPQNYDVVLLDRSMPELDGMEVLRRMKGHPTLRHVPVILQTAKTEPHEIVEGIDAGAYYYLTKPYDQNVMRSVVATCGEERSRFLSLQAQARRSALTATIADTARFSFRSLDEAHALAAFLANTCPNPDAAMTGFSELLINAVEHGNLAITYDEKSTLRAEGRWDAEVEHRLRLPEYRDRRVVVEFERSLDGIAVCIVDQGCGFDWRRYLSFDPARAMDNHGRGIAMAKAFSFDSLDYRGAGNEVVVLVRTAQKALAA